MNFTNCLLYQKVVRYIEMLRFLLIDFINICKGTRIHT